jgi:UDP-sugar transporter A1/2/3
MGNPQGAPDMEVGLIKEPTLPVGKFSKEDTSSRNQQLFKWFVLAFLTVQNSSASLLMRYSRSETGASWNPQTGVVMQEVIKALACVVLLIKDGGLASVFADRKEALKTAIPAICYLVQNNLQYIAVGYLDASAYAVLYQLKILTTALLSVVILKKDLVWIQWVSLGLLTMGVSAVVVSQMSPSSDPLKAKNSGSTDSILPGLAAVLTACLMSGLAGVYFEKLLKGSTVSLWARNLQLAVYSIVVGLCGLYGEHPDFVLQTDFFHGYTATVWFSILNNAFGGLLVAVVIKYADVILKNFSASLSIVLTAIFSSCFLGSNINGFFALGAALVIYAMFLYGKINPIDLLKKYLSVNSDMKELKSPHPRS